MRSFKKMHGLGNDFVIIDQRVDSGTSAPQLGSALLRKIADRRFGIGCDQVILLEQPKNKSADILMRIFNPDGGEVDACGNATRCVAAEIMREKDTKQATIETAVGLLECETTSDKKITVDMGSAKLDWRDIPLRDAVDTNQLDVGLFDLPPASCVNMGNPHAVFFVPDVTKIDIGGIGPKLETHAMFPQKSNIEFAQILNPQQIRMRVWERGAGITSACGTGACATLVAAVRRNLIADRNAEIILDGGSLWIEWLRDGHVMMTGGYSTSFVGLFDPNELLKQ